MHKKGRVRYELLRNIIFMIFIIRRINISWVGILYCRLFKKPHHNNVRTNASLVTLRLRLKPKCDCRREYSSLSTFPYFQQIAHFTGYTNWKFADLLFTSRLSVFFKSASCCCRLFVCLSRTVPKQYRLSIVVVG